MSEDGAILNWCREEKTEWEDSVDLESSVLNCLLRFA